MKNVTLASKNNFPIYYKYASNGVKQLMVSNNISSIQLRGNAENNIESQIIGAQMNMKMSVVDTSCFANCINLSSFSGHSIKRINDYAFYNCKQLSSVDFFNDVMHQLDSIGNYSFAKSGLTRIKLDLRSSVSDSSIGEYAFASCDNLTSFEFLDAPYLGSHMFDGCSRLSKVTITNKHNYVMPYCFANCTSLERITLPANMYMLPSHMFDGCTNLKEVKFEKNSVLNYIEDNVFANCPNLTSINLPAHINSLSVIDSEFLADSYIKEIAFAGLDDDAFSVKHIEVGNKVDFSLTSWIEANNNTAEDVVGKCLEKGIPIFILYSSASCPPCQQFNADVFNKTEWTDYMKIAGFAFIHTQYFSFIIKLLKKIGKGETLHQTPTVYMYWKKTDGTVAADECKAGYASGSYTPSKYIDLVKKTFKGYVPGGEDKITIEVREELTKFGSTNVDPLIYISSTGNKYECSNGNVVQKKDYRVDAYTTSDFKYGIWYRNARQLKAFADLNNLPVMVERSSLGCDPCNDFKRNTWQNETFQNAIKTKPCLFCRVEADGRETFDNPTTGQCYFVAHGWGKSNTLLPEILYYWKKPDGTTYEYDWNYNYRTDPANANYQTVLNRLDTMLGTYTGDLAYIAPDVKESNNGQCRYYINEENDDNGKYFICDKKERVTSYTGTITIDVNDLIAPPPVEVPSDSPPEFPLDPVPTTRVETSIQQGQTTVFAKSFTYQYFTSFGDAFFDRTGVIFKVDDEQKIEYIYRFENFQQQQYQIRDSNKYQTGTVFSIDSTTTELGLYDIIQYGGLEPEKAILIVEMDASDSSEIETKLLSNQSFLSWAKINQHLIIKIKSNDWSNNAPGAFRQIQQSINFNGNTIGSGLPKIFVLKHCKSCLSNGNSIVGAIRAAQVISYDGSKDVEFYTSSINTILAQAM